MYSDSEEEAEKQGASEDESPTEFAPRQANAQPHHILRQPVGFQFNAGNFQAASPYSAASSSGPYQQSQIQRPQPLSKSQALHQPKPNEGNSKKRKPRPTQWSHNDSPSPSITFATTSIADTNPHSSTNPNRLRSTTEQTKRSKKGESIDYRQHVADGTNMIPRTSYERDGVDVSSPYHDAGSSTPQHQRYEQLSSSSGESKNKYRSHPHGSRSDGQLNDPGSLYVPQNQRQEPPSSHRRHNIQLSLSTPQIPQQSSHGSIGAPAQQPHRPPPPLRILTLLIEDTRKDEGERDFLAEIKVPLKSDNPEDGFWADAKDVCKELQASPARIDGPAKAFTRRGKYKQYFLLVTARGTSEYSSTNLRVGKDRTIDVIVEGAPNAPEPALELTAQSSRFASPISATATSNSPRPFSSNKRKHDQISLLSEHPEGTSIPLSPLTSQHTVVSPPHSNHSPRLVSVEEGIGPPVKKRKADPNTSVTSPPNEQASGSEWGEFSAFASSSATAYDSGSKAQPTEPNAILQPEISKPDVTAQSNIFPPAGPVGSISSPQVNAQSNTSKSGPSNPRLVTGSESHKHSESDTAIVQWLKTHVTNEQGWNEFVESRRKTVTVGEQLKHYRFIESQFDRFVGKTTPEDLEDAPSCIITRSLVINSFGLPMTWGDNCTETLKLVELYGPGGTRLEDPTVVDMLDEPPAVTTGMQMREFLRLLRRIDEEWDMDHRSDGDE